MNQPKRVTRRPHPVEALQWDGKGSIIFFDWAFRDYGKEFSVDNETLSFYFYREPVRAYPGDWIIKEATGETYPCSNSNFSEDYIVEE